MTPEHIDPCLCTHIIYAFSEMTDNKLSPMEKYDHVDGDKPGFFERVNNWKSKNPKLRTLLAVGGWVYESFFTFKKKISISMSLLLTYFKEMGMGDFTNMVCFIFYQIF
jgi:GH18 family chitinase